MNLGPVAKALVGAAAAGVAPYTSAVLPGSQGGAHITLGEWLTVAVAILVAFPLVYRADNLRWFKYAKATAAAVVVFLGPLTVLLLADQTVTVSDILDALLKTALAFGLVSQVPNASVSEWHDSIGGDGQLEPVDPLELNPWATPDAAADDDDDLEPVDADGDGHDDRNGRWMPGNRGPVTFTANVGGYGVRNMTMPGGALALILGGATLD